MSRILVIEDDETVRGEILRILRFENHEVLEAAGGDAGLALAERHLPECILCDLLMPGLDGFETLARLRSHPATATIPIIFLTARASREDIRVGMDMGADDYVTKPFTAEELIAAVSTRLARREAMERENQKRLAELRDSITVALPHELRTPLTVVLGFAELLQFRSEHLAPGELVGIAADIHQAARRLEHLVENFLLYAQLELSAADPGGDGAGIAAGSVDAGPVIEEAAGRVARQLGRGADPVLNVLSAEVRISEQYLARIVEELAENALKFSAPGTPVIVQAAPDPAAGTYEVTVADEGRGMTAAEIASVGGLMQFGRRLHEQQGSGLGLVIARRLAELHGGRLEIRSDPGRATIVALRVPLA